MNDGSNARGRVLGARALRGLGPLQAGGSGVRVDDALHSGELHIGGGSHLQGAEGGEGSRGAEQEVPGDNSEVSFLLGEESDLLWAIRQ